jgi:glycine betaine/proline transport system permease protein
MDMWEDTMATLAIVSVATLLCIAIGIPIGIWMSRSDRVQKIITPVLDVMQTIPSFVYLIPVVMLLGIGKGAWSLGRDDLCKSSNYKINKFRYSIS